MAFNLAYAGSSIKKINNKEAIDFMLNSIVIYESPTTAGFFLRAFNYVGEGECQDSQVCKKDKLILITATFDEYPEKMAFEIPFSGTYKNFSVVSVPSKEDGAYIVKLHTNGNGGSCKVFEVKRQKILYKTDC